MVWVMIKKEMNWNVGVVWRETCIIWKRDKLTACWSDDDVIWVMIKEEMNWDVSLEYHIRET